MTTQPAIVHLVDDDTSFRNAIDRLLCESGYRTVQHKAAIEALRTISNGERGCLLLDVLMPELSGLELQEHFTKTGLALPVIFISGYGDISTSVRVIKAGAEDFLTKPVSKIVLLPAIARALDRYDKGHEVAVRTNTLRARVDTLTAREFEVFTLVVHGRLNKQIAHELGTAERTVKAHRHSIMEKLKARSVAEIVSIAVQVGLPVG